MFSPISPVAPIYKTGVRKQPYQPVYLQRKKAKKGFRDILEIEIGKVLNSKNPVKLEKK